jgi:hypothetical protein
LFLKNKISKENPAKDKLAGTIAGFLIKVQTKCSDFMNDKLSRVPVKKMKAFLILFCLFWGGLSGYYLFTAIFNKKQAPIKVESINVPRHINTTVDEQIEGRVDKETFDKIESYKKYMDSTHELIRPGLLDSINILEQIYLSQQKNEANEK